MLVLFRKPENAERKYRGHAMGQMSIFYGQHFVGFWKRADRGQRWIELAAAVRDAANRWTNALKICQIRGNPELHDELKRIIIFALARGEKRGADWRTHPLNKMRFEDYCSQQCRVVREVLETLETVEQTQ